MSTTGIYSTVFHSGYIRRREQTSTAMP